MLDSQVEVMTTMQPLPHPTWPTPTPPIHHPAPLGKPLWPGPTLPRASEQSWRSKVVWL
jgi:hypothetical protein